MTTMAELLYATPYSLATHGHTRLPPIMLSLLRCLGRRSDAQEGRGQNRLSPGATRKGDWVVPLRILSRATVLHRYQNSKVARALLHVYRIV